MAGLSGRMQCCGVKVKHGHLIPVCMHKCACMVKLVFERTALVRLLTVLCDTVIQKYAMIMLLQSYTMYLLCI